MTVLVGQVAARLGEPDGIIAFDPRSFPKRGTHSVGVKRQWCGHRGKVDNCQVGVFRGYVSHHDHALLDFRLSLPEEWARDKHRRQACHVPPEVHYQTRQAQCLEMLDVWGAQVPHSWVTGDDALGRHTRFRDELRQRGKRYVLGVPCTTTMRDLEAPLPAYPADLLPHFGQATPYNPLVSLLLEDRKSRGVSAYMLCKLLAWGKGVPNASSIAF